MGLGFSPNDDMGDEAVVISHADGHADTYWNVDTPVQYALPTGDEGVARDEFNSPTSHLNLRFSVAICLNC